MNDDIEDNDIVLDYDEVIWESRQRQIVLVTFLMALAYALYGVVNLFLSSKGLPVSAGLNRLIFTFFLFLILTFISYKHGFEKLASVGLKVVPIVVSIMALIVTDVEMISFYLVEMGVLIVWVFVVSGLRYKEALLTSTMILLITFYSTLVYHAQENVSFLLTQE